MKFKGCIQRYSLKIDTQGDRADSRSGYALGRGSYPEPPLIWELLHKVIHFYKRLTSKNYMGTKGKNEKFSTKMHS